MFFHSNMAWHPATYDVISRNRRNWPSPNLSQNAREERVATISPLVRPRVNLTMFVFEQISQGKVFDEVLYRKESHSKLENIDL